MTGPMQPLPPEAVAGIDQRAGECDAGLDIQIARWRMIAASHGSAAATHVIAMDFYMSPVKDFRNIVDSLAFAIARLADKER